MNPSTIYYLGLYLLVFVIRFFKLRKEFIPNSGTETKAVFPFRKVFFVSLEIVYTSAGFIIILLENQKDWISGIVIFYIILVLISSNFDSMDERFTDKTKLIVHLVIICIIVLGTIYSLNTFLLTPPKNGKETNENQIYRIALPYSDNSLIAHLGYNKFGDKKLVFLTEVNAQSNKEAIEKASKLFWADALTDPMIIKKSQTKESLIKLDSVNAFVIKKY